MRRACARCRAPDIATSTHRGHHHALAKGVPPEALFAELYGHAGGTSGGRGGSMHIHHRPSGFLGTNAIVGGGLAWAAGAAWARRRRGGGDDIAVAFTGDGAVAQGAFHEVLRLSQFWRRRVCSSARTTASRIPCRQHVSSARRVRLPKSSPLPGCRRGSRTDATSLEVRAVAEESDRRGKRLAGPHSSSARSTASRRTA